MAEVNRRENEEVIINPSPEEEKIDKKQAEMRVREILQNMFIMGAVSNEPTDIQNILEQLKEDSISPSEAVKMARGIENNRQENYH